MKKYIHITNLLMGMLILLLCVFPMQEAIASDQPNSSDQCPEGDINNDCQIGLEEAIIALKVIAGYTTDLTATQSPDPITQSEQSTASSNLDDKSQELLSDLSGIVAFIESLNIQEHGLADIIKSMINDANIPCGKVVIDNFYPFKASFQFDGSEECLGVSGDVQLQSKIFDTTAYLTFNNFTFKTYSIKGDAIASVTPSNGGYKAVLSSESFLICGHEFSGFLFATSSDLTNKALLVGMKGTDTFQFGDNAIKLEADLTYTHEGGANGIAKAIINNEVIKLTFRDFVIDLNKLAPVSGVMKINGTSVDFGF